MSRRLEIELPGAQARAEFELFEEAAPQAVSIVWNALSDEVEVPCYHAIFCGREVFWYLPAAVPDPAIEENQAFRCEPGDLLFFQMKAGRVRPREARPVAERQRQEDIFELAVIYGVSDFTLVTLEGWRPCVIGRIATEPQEFFDACATVLDRGIQPVVTRRCMTNGGHGSPTGRT